MIKQNDDAPDAPESARANDGEVISGTPASHRPAKYLRLRSAAAILLGNGSVCTMIRSSIVRLLARPRGRARDGCRRETSKQTVAPMLSKLQQECWDGYVATGRGCHTLFQLLDTDSSGTVSWKEIRFFLENVRENDVNPEARKQVRKVGDRGRGGGGQQGFATVF